MSNRMKFVVALARTYNNIFSKIEKNIQSFGFTISEFGVLEFLYHKGDQPVQKVAEKILVTSGTITYVIDKLQKMDLVERRKCETDKRVYYISLTEKGTQIIKDIFPKHEKFINELFKEIEPDLMEKGLSDLVNINKKVIIEGVE